MNFKNLIFICLIIFVTLAFSGCQKTGSTELPGKVLEQYLEAWVWGDTAKMYNLLSDEEKKFSSFTEYNQNFEEFPLRPYRFKILGTRISGKTAKIKIELWLPAITETSRGQKNENKIEVSKGKVTFILKKENSNWRVAEKESLRKL